MDRTTFMNNYFRYYILLENKFTSTLNYVELAEENFSTYSVEYAHQLLAIGSELDSFFKIYCGFNSDDRKNIIHYTRHIMNSYPKITSQKIEIINTDIEIAPYADWEQWNPSNNTGNLLDWWEAYNSVKHNRQNNITKASMKNVINSLAALHLIEMKYLQAITKGTKEPDEPELRSEIFKLKDWKFNFGIVDYLFDRAENQSH